MCGHASHWANVNTGRPTVCSTKPNVAQRNLTTVFVLRVTMSFCPIAIFSPPVSDSLRKRTWVLLWFIFFFFFLSRNLRAPWADRREIFHDAPKYIQFDNPGPKFWGSLPEKFLGAKNMQNLARFWSDLVNFKVWRPISLERMKIFKIGELLVRHRFLPR